MLHYVCCLMPKPHRDTMEVLFVFLKWVASFSHVDEETGSKMDLQNLATVISPNILYAKGKDPARDESFSAARVVHELLELQDEFWEVSYSPFCRVALTVCVRTSSSLSITVAGSRRVPLHPQRPGALRQPVATHLERDPRPRRESHSPLWARHRLQGVARPGEPSPTTRPAGCVRLAQRRA